jgi:cytochrome c55X
MISITPFHALAGPVSQPRQDELINLLKHDCGSCHGMTLKGGLGPALTKEALASKPADFLYNTIMLGRDHTAMPPWNNFLSNDEAVWLVDRLRDGNFSESGAHE